MYSLNAHEKRIVKWTDASRSSLSTFLAFDTAFQHLGSCKDNIEMLQNLLIRFLHTCEVDSAPTAMPLGAMIIFSLIFEGIMVQIKFLEKYVVLLEKVLVHNQRANR